jgi:site-specific DNA-methyltransferase (adenine-specific)
VRRSTSRAATTCYADAFEDYTAFLAPHLARTRELLAAHGTLYLHLDYRAAHRAKILLDELFGPDCFLNELIWIYDYGGRPKRRGPPGTTRSSSTCATASAITSTTTRSIASRTWRGPRRPREGGPRQAPERLLVAHDRADELAREDRLPDAEAGGDRAPDGRRLHAPGGWCLDPFVGSGTLGSVCRTLDRRFVLLESSPEAVAVTRARLDAARAASRRSPSGRPTRVGLPLRVVVAPPTSRAIRRPAARVRLTWGACPPITTSPATRRRSRRRCGRPTPSAAGRRPRRRAR